FRVFGCRCYLLNDYEDVGKLKAKGDIEVFVGYSKESAAFRIYNKQTRKIHESVNVNSDEISEMASKQFSLEPGLSNLNETGKSLNRSVSKVDEASKNDLEYLFQDFYDEYFDSSKIMNSFTTNVESPINEEVFHEVSESFQGESSSSSLNDDVQQSPEEVILPQTSTQLISNNMVPNSDEASTSHNVFNERLEDAYFDASTSFHDPFIEPANVAEALRDADWVSAMQEECLEPSLYNLNETGKSSNLSVSQVDEASKKDLEDLFKDFYDKYFDSSKIMKSSTTNVETPINEKVFHESIPINMVPNGDEASTSHNVFNERLEDAYFDASTSFHDLSNVQTFYQPYPHEKKWTKDHPLHKIIGDPKSSVRIRGKSVIKTKWIFKNKKDESSLVIRNKARLVVVGYSQQEGIDYDETFAPVTRIKATCLYLAYASHKDFIVYQMDVKITILD
nr:retrovirus-related Pol polyprotein from transposon TNT 1-94 [Tanacetum cinerariifolium]